ncbi:MAG: glycosyltransferase family 2 protein [Flavobacteriia bacterium]|jgi:glycosyltransferase involved in cell wall biosynthesis
MMNNSPLISVVMITYDHEDFIEQAINSILEQKGDFNIELIIADDFSPDKTENIVTGIIETYSGKTQIHYFRHKKNLGFQKNFKFALEKARGKYIALCEGDDYWVDSTKLKKQLEFLETYPEYILCATRSYVLDKNQVIHSQEEKYKGLEFPYTFKQKDFLSPFLLDTNTIIWRNSVDFKGITYKGFKDILCFAVVLNQGLGVILDKYTGVYRHHEKSVWSLRSELNQFTQNMITYKQLNKLFPYIEEFKKTEITNLEYLIQLILKTKNERLLLLGILLSYFKSLKNVSIKLKVRRMSQIFFYLIRGKISL